MDYELLTIGIFSMIFLAFFVNKIIENHKEKTYFDYKIQKMKFKKPSNTKKRDIDEDSDFEDFEDSLPSWLENVLDGAGINLEKFYQGDQNELSKLKTMIDKIPGPQNQDYDKGLIG